MNNKKDMKTCEDGDMCPSCTLGGEMLKLGIQPRFKVNEETGHCQFYTEAPYDSDGDYDHDL